MQYNELIRKYQVKGYEIVTTKLQMKRLSKKLKTLEEFAFDTETNTLRVYGPNEDFILVGISISWGAYRNYYIPLGHYFDEGQLDLSYVVRHLKYAYERLDVRIIGANLKFDMHVMARVGITIRTKDLFDTNIASWLCNENTFNGLKFNTEEVLKVKQGKFDEVLKTVTNAEKKEYGLRANSKPPFNLVRIHNGAPYALDDAYFTFELYLYFMDKLASEEMDQIYWKVYTKFQRTLFEMEERGTTVDLDRLQAMKAEIHEDVEKAMYELVEMVGVEFNPNSSQQLNEIIYGFNGTEVLKTNKKGESVPIYPNPNYELIDNSFGLPIIARTPTGAPKANSDTLNALLKKSYKSGKKKKGIEFVYKLVGYSKLNKLVSFVEGVEKNLYSDNKVHATCKIIGTTSGRISMAEPNLQQLPKSLEGDPDGIYELAMKYAIRELFIGGIDENTGKRKKIIAIDYDNLEMRVLAHFSEDELLMTMFNRGDDSHGSTAVNMFGLDCDPNECKKLYPKLRQVGKVLNFLLVYGGGAMALYDMLKKYGVDLNDKEYLEEYNCRSGKEVAQLFIDKYFDTYSGVSSFLKDQKKFAHRNLFVYTITGRKRRLFNINSSDFRLASYEERLSLNQPIQGTAGDITINAQNRVNADEFLKAVGCDMLIQVHDELVFECPEEHVQEVIPIIKHYMEHPFGDNVELNLPFTATADWGESYEEAK